MFRYLFLKRGAFEERERENIIICVVILDYYSR